MSEKKEASHPQKQYKEAPEESEHLEEHKEHYEEEEDRVSVTVIAPLSLTLLIVVSLFFQLHHVHRKPKRKYHRKKRPKHRKEQGNSEKPITATYNLFFID